MRQEPSLSSYAYAAWQAFGTLIVTGWVNLQDYLRATSSLPAPPTYASVQQRERVQLIVVGPRPKHGITGPPVERAVHNRRAADDGTAAGELPKQLPVRGVQGNHVSRQRARIEHAIRYGHLSFSANSLRRIQWVLPCRGYLPQHRSSRRIERGPRPALHAAVFAGCSR